MDESILLFNTPRDYISRYIVARTLVSTSSLPLLGNSFQRGTFSSSGFMNCARP
jgi:hypothetical protein